MKNIRFYSAKKYESNQYLKVEDCIYKTIEKELNSDDYFGLRQLEDNELASQLKSTKGWIKGVGEFIDSYLVLEYQGKKYYRDIDEIDTVEDVVFIEYKDDEEHYIYVTSIVFEAEPELGENEPNDPYVSQYPLEDILDHFDVYCYDSYDEKNKADYINSYVEFASDDIDDIKSVLSIIGKHVYNYEEGDYVKLKIE